MDRFPPPHPIYPPVIHYGPAPIPLRKEPHIPLTPKTGMRREEIERRIAEAGVTAEEKAAWNAKYAKPSTGIPKTDLASGVQASLGKADTALQEHQSLSGYVQKSVIFDNPDTTPKVKSSLLPSYVDDVLEFASLSAFPSTGETGKIYVAKDTNKTYRWTGTQYVQVGGDEQAQADWAQTNSSAPDFIKNKPTIPAAQVQANWNETDTSSKAFIQNKPTIPTVPTNVSSFTNDAGYLTQHQSLSAYRTATAQDAIDSGKASAADVTAIQNIIPSTATPTNKLATAADVPAAQVNADWNASSGVAQILNKPTIPGPAPVTSVNGETGDVALYGNTLIMGQGQSTLVSTAITNAQSDATRALNELPFKATAASIAPAFSTSSTYAVGDYVTHEGLLYKCTTAVTTAGAWNAANWSAVAVTDEMGADTPLPFDAECEYVTVPAGAYVDPEIVDIGPPNAYDIDARIRIPTYGSFRFGNWREGDQTKSFMIFNYSGGGYKLCKYWADSGSGIAQTSDFFQIKTQSNSYTLNGTTRTCTPTTTVQENASFIICGLDNKVDGQKGGSEVDIDIAYFRFIGNTVLRDLVPVRVGQVGYLYDKISGRLFGSAVGSIPLVPGPDKATPTITTPGRIVELTPAIRYAFAAPTPSVSGTAATVACEDRAINDFTVATGITSLTITPPAAVTGRARDFFCRVTLTDSSLPTVTLSGGTIDIGSTEVAGMTQGVNLLMFTEIASGHWLASRRSAS